MDIFQAQPWTLAFSVVVFAVVCVLSLLAWQRSHFSRGHGLLELLRVVLVAMVLATLNQPEWTKEIRPDQRPKIAVLYDTSNSMQTRDVLDAQNPALKARTRAEVVEPLVSEEKWKPIDERMDVVIEGFSSAEVEPEKATDINSALEKLLDAHPTLRGVVLLSDGDWNVGGSPSSTAGRLRTRKVPVYAVGVGSNKRLPDVELVSLDAQKKVVINKTERIPFVIRSAMPRDHEANLTLMVEKHINEDTYAPTGKTVQKVVRIPAMGRVQDTIEWKPSEIGKFRLTLKVPEAQGELLTENNAKDTVVDVAKEALKVLIVESFPRWEYRYIRNALERDPGVEVNCLMFHPNLKGVGGGRGYLKTFPAEDALSKYDVVFLGDVGVEVGQLGIEDVKNIRRLVRSQAGGLVFLPGFRGYQLSLLQTEIEDLYPVVLDAAQPKGYGSPRPAQFELTESGRRSLLTRLSSDDEANVQIWNTLPGFQWFAAALRAKAGSEVLATHQTESTRFGRVPLIVARTSGTGKILFMGTDGAWRWREGVEDLYHYRFWGQVVRWMAFQRQVSEGDGELMRLYFTRNSHSVGDVMTFNANVMSDSGEPLQNGTVTVQIESPSGQTDTVRLQPAGEELWGLFTGSFELKEGGTHQLVTTCRETGNQLLTEVYVQGRDLEKLGQPARFDVMKEIAKISRGRVATVADMNEIMEQVAALPEPKPEIRKERLWSNPWWGGLIVLLLGIFWTGRKMIGVV